MFEELRKQKGQHWAHRKNSKQYECSLCCVVWSTRCKTAHSTYTHTHKCSARNANVHGDSKKLGVNSNCCQDETTKNNYINNELTCLVVVWSTRCLLLCVYLCWCFCVFYHTLFFPIRLKAIDGLTSEMCGIQIERITDDDIVVAVKSEG